MGQTFRPNRSDGGWGGVAERCGGEAALKPVDLWSRPR
jgi:hypothetical protein